MRPLRASLVVLSLLICACSSTAPSSEPEAPFITLEMERGGRFWLATWHLDEPARAIVFERPASGFRSALFEILTPGVEFDTDGNLEVLRTDGAPVAAIAVRLPVSTRWLEKEYAFFQEFSDGSTSIYTGHLVARRLEPGPEECDECFIRSFRFLAPPGTSIMVGGRVHESPLDWVDAEQQGTYVYFGAIPPVETPQMISIIDPALPDWLEDETRAALPSLFALYERELGVELPERPTVLFNFPESESPGYSSGGGTLPGLIQLTVHGEGWGERSDEAMLHLFHFLAHEAAHLWNGQIVQYPDSDDSWMHEGSADALAERTLHRIGLIGETRFLEYQTAALNECRRGLDSFPLREAGDRGDFHLYYSCGNVIALLTERATEDGDLFRFWKELIGRSLESRVYDADDYFAVLRSLEADAETIESLLRFIETGATSDSIVEMLIRNGVEVVGDDDPPESYGQPVAREALMVLMEDHCRGRYGFNAGHDGLHLADALDCDALPGGATVTGIGGHDVLREGHRTWDVLHERCGTDRPVSVLITKDGTESRIEIPCTTAVRPRPAYVRITD